jgi:sugar O-acyltransferase (sialic acid O-acetyltransferase NeuD family)
MKKLVIVGASLFAEVAYTYFSKDTEYEVVAFAIEGDFLGKSSAKLFDLQITPFETLEDSHPPSDYSAFVAITYTKLNRVRTRLYTSLKEKGYHLASYISPSAFITPTTSIGDNCFIFEDNTIQPFTHIGNNVILWSGNHVGHHSTIADNCFVSSHVVISGNCSIGASTFLGVNSTISNDITVETDNWIGPCCLITKNTRPSSIYTTDPAKLSKISTERFFGL